MATELFDHAAEHLERQTDLDRLEARGTLRLAIKEAGLDVKTLTLAELSVVFENTDAQRTPTPWGRWRGHGLSFHHGGNRANR